MFRIALLTAVIFSAVAAGQPPLPRRDAPLPEALRVLKLEVELREAKLVLAHVESDAGKANAEESQARLAGLKKVRAKNPMAVTMEEFHAAELQAARYQAEARARQAQVRVAELQLEVARARLEAAKDNK
jgi:multidrug efflux pump subunit AcrA (membrane-fusion protein)